MITKVFIHDFGNGVVISIDNGICVVDDIKAYGLTNDRLHLINKLANSKKDGWSITISDEITFSNENEIYIFPLSDIKTGVENILSLIKPKILKIDVYDDFINIDNNSFTTSNINEINVHTIQLNVKCNNLDNLTLIRNFIDNIDYQILEIKGEFPTTGIPAHKIRVNFY